MKGDTSDHDKLPIHPRDIPDLRTLADKAKMEGRFDAGQRLHALLDTYEDHYDGEEEVDMEELEGTVDDIETNVRDLEEHVAAVKGKEPPDEPKKNKRREVPTLADRLAEVDSKLSDANEALEELAEKQAELRKASAGMIECEQTIGHLVNACSGHYPEETDHGRELLAIANAGTEDEARALVLSFMDTLSPAKVYELAKMFTACAWALHYLNDQVNEALTA